VQQIDGSGRAQHSQTGMMLPDHPRRCRGRSFEDLCALERICRVIAGPVEVPRSWRYEVTTRKLQLFRSDCKNYLSATSPTLQHFSITHHLLQVQLKCLLRAHVVATTPPSTPTLPCNPAAQHRPPCLKQWATSASSAWLYVHRAPGSSRI
jgi:hypothetical protein